MDDLDRAIDRRTAKNPDFPKLLAAETKRLVLINSLLALRKKNGLSQADVARAMGVGQSVVAEIESGQIKVRYTTLDRYVSAVSREKARLTIGRVRAVSGRA
jgi:predicted transcriptional regulator